MGRGDINVDCRKCIHCRAVKPGVSVKCNNADSDTAPLPWDVVTEFPCFGFRAKKAGTR